MNFRKKLIEQAAPTGVKANVIPIKKMIEVAKDPRLVTLKPFFFSKLHKTLLQQSKVAYQLKH